jgi:hypothetical protein
VWNASNSGKADADTAPKVKGGTATVTGHRDGPQPSHGRLNGPRGAAHRVAGADPADHDRRGRTACPRWADAEPSGGAPRGGPGPAPLRSGRAAAILGRCALPGAPWRPNPCPPWRGRRSRRRRAASLPAHAYQAPQPTRPLLIPKKQQTPPRPPESNIILLNIWRFHRISLRY